MTQIILDRLQNGCVIKVDVTAKYKLRLTLADIINGGGLGFGAVSYPGQGKYGGSKWEESKEYFVRWQDIPNDESDPTQEPTPTGTPDSGWWPDNEWWPVRRHRLHLDLVLVSATGR